MILDLNEVCGGLGSCYFTTRSDRYWKESKGQIKSLGFCSYSEYRASRSWTSGRRGTTPGFLLATFFPRFGDSLIDLIIYLSWIKFETCIIRGPRLISCESCAIFIFNSIISCIKGRMDVAGPSVKVVMTFMQWQCIKNEEYLLLGDPTHTVF